MKDSPPPVPSASESSSEQRGQDVVRELQQAVETGAWARAERLATQAMIASPNDPDVLTNAAIAKAAGGDRDAATNLLVESAKASGYDTDTDQVDLAIGALVDLGRVHDAIELIELVLLKVPSDHKHRRMLVGFLGEVQLNKDINEHMSFLIRDRRFDLPLLLATTETATRQFSTANIEELLKRNPRDHRPRLGIAQEHLQQRNFREAEQILKDIIEHHPIFEPAHALLGRSLVLQGKMDALAQWHDELPSQASDYPNYWFALGAVARASGKTAVAVRALGEGVRRDPNDIAILTWLSQAIRSWAVASNATELTERYPVDGIIAAIDKRIQDLLELREHFSIFNREDERSQTLAAAIARELLELGRNWEAAAWLDIADELAGQPPDDLHSLRRKVASRLAVDKNWQSRREHPELDFDLTQFPLPLSPGSQSPTSTATTHRVFDDDLARPIRLSEEASQRGLNFYGSVGSGVHDPFVPITQTLGCGGGVIDIDQDGNHDLVFTAAGGSIRRRDSMPGAIFRNLGSSFIDITSESGFHDPGFGHGVAIGDYNDDGFRDILVLNLGRNSLFRNNGDGTFQDVSAELPEHGRGEWSTSAAIIDLNGDGYNNFVIVNYCETSESIDERCFHTDGREINCYPRRFRAGRDQFGQVAPDGRFVDVSDEWTARVVLGRGLGVVAGRLNGHSQAVYVVNDASANHLYHWQQNGQMSPLIESAVARGLAVDIQSLDQGSMGIASSDFDGDGDLDFYVTGFAEEYNIFYEQQNSGLWSDRTASQKMVTPHIGYGWLRHRGH